MPLLDGRRCFGARRVNCDAFDEGSGVVRGLFIVHRVKLGNPFDLPCFERLIEFDQILPFNRDHHVEFLRIAIFERDVQPHAPLGPDVGKHGIAQALGGFGKLEADFEVSFFFGAWFKRTVRRFFRHR